MTLGPKVNFVIGGRSTAGQVGLPYMTFAEN